MKTIALIEKGKNGDYSIFTPNLESTIMGEGLTVKEAKSDFENSFSEIVRFYSESNESLPSEFQDLEFEYKYDLSSLFNYYKFINVSRFAEIAGINPSLMRQYKRGDTYISEKQIAKIQNTLRELGKELATINLI